MKLPERIYHLAEAANWRSIGRSGLLSTKALLDAADVHGKERARIECGQRLKHIELPNGVQVRDQKPMPAKALKQCLVSMPPEEWYALINSKVLFWLEVERLNGQRQAFEPGPQAFREIESD